MLSLRARNGLASGKMRMCGAADVRMFKRVNCGEILRGLSVDVMGKMRRCRYVIALSSRISCFLLSSSVSEKGLHFTCQLPAVHIVIQIENLSFKNTLFIRFFFL